MAGQLVVVAVPWEAAFQHRYRRGLARAESVAVVDA